MDNKAIIMRVKKNLIIDFTDDDGIISAYIAAAISYAESYQHLERNYYRNNEMSETTLQGVVMLASHYLESENGRILRQTLGKPTYTATLVKYCDLICDKPNGQAKLTGISRSGN